MSGTIDQLWQRIYSMTQSQTSPRTWGGHLSLPPKFDQELLNNVTKLKSLKDDEKTDQIEVVRGQILVATSVGLIGKGDVEELQQLLDKIQESK